MGDRHWSLAHRHWLEDPTARLTLVPSPSQHSTLNINVLARQQHQCHTYT
jgi:hypothetical protein